MSNSTFFSAEELGSELFAAAKKIKLRAKHLVEEQLVGNYRSSFKGSGLNFSDLRQYTPGDEIRHIHWKASARSGKTYVKTYEEERQLSIMLLVDTSASMFCGGSSSVYKRAIELSALISFLAQSHQDLLGLCRFSNQVDTFIPCSNKRNIFYQIMHELLVAPDTSKSPTQLSNALLHCHKYIKRRLTLFIISDFLGTEYQRELAQVASKHDTICCHLKHITPSLNAGLVRMFNSETGEAFIFDSSSKRSRRYLLESTNSHQNKVRSICNESNADYFECTDNVVGSFKNFMQSRLRSR